MSLHRRSEPIEVVGLIPYRMALAGGWIDQPFVSKFNPQPPGSMVVVSLQPVNWFMERSGMATGTRKVAAAMWPDGVPSGHRVQLVRQLFDAENRGKLVPSGSQDMAGLIFPGISRLDYDYEANSGVFPCHVETNQDVSVVAWLERVLHIVPVAPRPPLYSPLGDKRLTADWIGRLGQSGKACFDAICKCDVLGLGESLNECMACWDAILPHTLCHPTLEVDLVGLLRHYQRRYYGAGYSGCGGGYLYIVSDDPVPGAFSPCIRVEGDAP